MKNKEEESKEKTADYDWAKAQYDYATALANARNELADALAEVKAANKAKTDADSAMTTATSNVKSKATTMKSGNYTTINNGKNAMSPRAGGGLLTTNQIAVGTNNDYPKAKANYTTLCNTYDTIFTDTPSDSLMKQIFAKLGEIEADTGAIPNLSDDAKVAQVVADASALKTLVDSLVTNLDTYEKTFANFVDNNLEEAGVTPDTAAGKKADIHALLTAAKALQTEAANLVTLAGTYNSKYTDYKDKNSAYDNADESNPGELQQWGTALTTYNNAVKNADAGARATFNGVVTNINDRGIYKSHEAGTYHSDADKYEVAEADVAEPIVKNYSANTADDNVDPTITWTQGGFAGYTLDKVALPTESAYNLPALLNAKNNAARVYANAQTAYNNAENNDPAEAGTNLKLYVNLADGYDADWQIDNRTNGSTAVDFYLKKVLKAGETSGQLVDSVTMDSSVNVNTYKNFQLDLNVGLDSIQVTYDANQNGYDPATANASDDFNMTATVTGDTVTWTAANVKIENKSVTTLTKGSPLQLRASVDEGARDNTIVWSSSDTNVASVDENGLVTGIKSGTATITVTATNGTEDTSDDVTDTITISVSNPATRLELDQNNVVLPLNKEITLNATITPSDADGVVTWSTDNDSIATVANGTVTPHSKGTTTITAMIGGRTATCVVNVTESVVTESVVTFDHVQVDAYGSFSQHGIECEYKYDGGHHSNNSREGVSFVYFPGEDEDAPTVTGSTEGLYGGSLYALEWGHLEIVVDEGKITKIEIDGSVVWDGTSDGPYEPASSVPFNNYDTRFSTIKITVQK